MKLWKRHKRNWLAHSETTTRKYNWWWCWWWIYIYIYIYIYNTFIYIIIICIYIICRPDIYIFSLFLRCSRCDRFFAVFSDCKADVIFVLDSSGNIGVTHWFYAKQFVMDVVQGLNVRQLRFLRKWPLVYFSKVLVCLNILLFLVVDSQRSLCGRQDAYGQYIFHY